MKPAPFDYAAPETLDGVLALLAEHGGDAKILAGGQSLVPMLNFRLARPEVLVDVNGLAGLDDVGVGEDGALYLGALVRQRRLVDDPRVVQRTPLVAEAAPYIAHPQIRNRGTLGGSLSHADPASELPVVAVALRSRMRLMRHGGDRWVSADDFFVSLLTTALESDEMLIEVAFPAQPERTGWAFEEVARRHGDYAQAGVAAVLTLGEDGRCTAARLVYLSLGDIPTVAPQAAEMLVGENLGAAPKERRRDLFQSVADTAARHEVDPCGDIHATVDFKRHLARVLTVRVLERALSRALGSSQDSPFGGAVGASDS